MNVLTVPRTVAALPYKALRLPSRLVETQVVGRLFAEDSALRLGIERSLASLDASVGCLLQDDELSRRGTAVARKADALEVATALEEKAAIRKAEAEQALAEKKSAAARKRADAAQDKARKSAEIAREEQDEKQAAARKADEREKAAARAIEQQASVELAAEQQRLTTQQDRVQTQVDARTAAPKAQFEQAVDRSAEAAAERADADRLAELADAEKTARQDVS